MNVSSERHHFLAAALAGAIAVLVSCAGPFMMILATSSKAHLTAAQASSWIGMLIIGSGLCSIWLSWRNKAPILCATNMPSVASISMLLAAFPYSEVLGGYMLAGLCTWLLARSGFFDWLMNIIPMSICGAMLAGVLLHFVSSAVSLVRSDDFHTPWLILGMFVAYVIGKRYIARYCMLISLLIGIFCWYFFGWSVGIQSSSIDPVPSHFGWMTHFVFTMPTFSRSTLLWVGLPILLRGLTSQNLPGLAILRASNYKPVSRNILEATGLFSVLLAPFGVHGITLSPVVGAIGTGQDAHPNEKDRWITGVIYGVISVIFGMFAGVIVYCFGQLPTVLASIVAGIALLGALQFGLTHAFAIPDEREAGLFTFVIAASGIHVLGMGSSFWGLLLGTLLLIFNRSRFYKIQE